MAHVVNRTTLEVKKSIHTPDFSEPTWKLCSQAEVDSITSVDQDFIIIDAITTLLRAMTDAEIDSLKLVKYKSKKMTLVDSETSRRLGLGFTHLGKTFSMAITSQINLLGAKSKADEWIVSDFPIRASTIDNLDSLLLNNATEVKDWFNSAIAYGKSKLNDGNTVKHNIRNSLTKAAVDTAAVSYLAGGAP